MYHHSESRASKHSPDDLFDLVADIEKYPEFLPWCRALRIRHKTEKQLVADLQIGFRLYSESFTTRVTLDRDNQRIDVIYEDGPFEMLESAWHFEHNDTSENSASKAGTIVHFYVRFAFKTKILDRLLGPVFNEAVLKMVRAFEIRANHLYDK